MNTNTAFQIGDVVARKNDNRTGTIRSFDREAGTFGIYWFNRTSGGGWRPSDLVLVRTAADEAKRREANAAAEAAQMSAALFARVRGAVGLPDWHSDEIADEIARVRACSTLEAYLAISREGAKTPLGAKRKIAIWNVIRS